VTINTGPMGGLRRAICAVSVPAVSEGCGGEREGNGASRHVFFCLIRRFYRSPVSPAVLALRLSDAFNRRARYSYKKERRPDLRARHTGEVAGGSMAGKFDLGLHRVGMINNPRISRYPPPVYAG